jgi:hypothetical protein
VQACCSSLDNTVSNADNMALNDWTLANNNVKGRSCICFKKLWKSEKILNLENMCLGRDSNRARSEYKTEEFQAEPTWSATVLILYIITLFRVSKGRILTYCKCFSVNVIHAARNPTYTVI